MKSLWLIALLLVVCIWFADGKKQKKTKLVEHDVKASAEIANGNSTEGAEHKGNHGDNEEQVNDVICFTTVRGNWTYKTITLKGDLLTRL